jgi:hypothetical protein
LINGLKANPKYQLEANLMELLPNQTWDSITNNLRQYDRSDTNLKKELQQVFIVTVVVKLVISNLIAPINNRRDRKVMVVAAVVAKVVIRVFLEAAEVKEKAAGENKMAVEAVDKKVVKAKPLQIMLTHVLVISVIRQATSPLTVNTHKSLRG